MRSGGVCVRSAVGAHTGCVYTCTDWIQRAGLDDDDAALESSQPLCLEHTGPRGGPREGPRELVRRHDPDSSQPLPPETAVQITQLEKIIQTYQGGAATGIRVTVSISMRMFPTGGVFITVETSGQHLSGTVTQVDSG